MALDMGLGKTAIAVTAASHLPELKSMLVMCPAVAVENWKRELKLWGMNLELVKVWPYSMVQKLETAMPWDLAILDESHFLKSTEAQRTKLVYGRNGILQKSKRVWCLSGTPTPNHAGELWPMLRAFGATSLDYEKFTKRYCVGRTIKIKERYVSQITGTRMESIPELQRLLAPYTLRKRKEDVLLELPPISFETVTVPAGNVVPDADTSFVKYFVVKDRSAELFAQLERERDMVKAAMDAVNERTPAGFKTLQAIAPAVPTLRRWVGLQKVEPVAEMVRDELEDGLYEKIVIFAIHQGVIEGLRYRLRKFGAVTLYGGTPPDKRQKHIDKFQKFSNCRVFIGNIHSAGTAITLTASNQVLFVEQDWVPANNAQAAMRCHRIGQERPVTVRFVSIADSIDERITEVVKRKTREVACLMDGLSPRPAYREEDLASTLPTLDSLCQ